MTRKTVVAGALLVAAGTVLANQLWEIGTTVPLKDGSSLHIFRDGKMAMEDRFGRAVRMSPGQAMLTLDGRTITMVGDETARLDSIRKTQLGSGR